MSNPKLKEKTEDPSAKFPIDVLRLVISYLKLSDVKNLSLTNKSWFSVCQDPIIVNNMSFYNCINSGKDFIECMEKKKKINQNINF